MYSKPFRYAYSLVNNDLNSFMAETTTDKIDFSKAEPKIEMEIYKNTGDIHTGIFPEENDRFEQKLSYQPFYYFWLGENNRRRENIKNVNFHNDKQNLFKDEGEERFMKYTQNYNFNTNYYSENTNENLKTNSLMSQNLPYMFIMNMNVNVKIPEKQEVSRKSLCKNSTAHQDDVMNPTLINLPFPYYNYPISTDEYPFKNCMQMNNENCKTFGKILLHKRRKPKQNNMTKKHHKKISSLFQNYKTMGNQPTKYNMAKLNAIHQNKFESEDSVIDLTVNTTETKTVSPGREIYTKTNSSQIMKDADKGNTMNSTVYPNNQAKPTDIDYTLNIITEKATNLKKNQTNDLKKDNEIEINDFSKNSNITILTKNTITTEHNI